jgi:hypothetical protein
MYGQDNAVYPAIIEYGINDPIADTPGKIAPALHGVCEDKPQT